MRTNTDYIAPNGPPLDPLRQENIRQNVEYFVTRLREISSKLNQISYYPESSESHTAQLGSAEARRDSVERINTILIGLERRTKRSDYYRAQSKEITPYLREDRIESFQTYLQYVAEKLSATYAVIQDVGEQKKRLESNITTLTQLVRTTEAARLQATTTRFSRISNTAFWSIGAPLTITLLFGPLFGDRFKKILVPALFALGVSVASLDTVYRRHLSSAAREIVTRRIPATIKTRLKSASEKIQRRREEEVDSIIDRNSSRRIRSSSPTPK